VTDDVTWLHRSRSWPQNLWGLNLAPMTSCDPKWWLVFSFPGSLFPGIRDSRRFSFPDSRELKCRHSRRKAGTSHRQLVVKWDARQWLQRIQTSLAGQLTAAGSRSTKQLCCVHYGVRLVAVAALQGQPACCHSCLQFRLSLAAEIVCMHDHWRRKCQRWQTRMLHRTRLSAICCPYHRRPWTGM